MILGSWEVSVYRRLINHEGRSHEAHEDKPLMQTTKCIQLVGVVSDARTPDRVMNPVVRIGGGGDEAQRYVNVAWLWGVRVARAMRAMGRATRRSQAEQQHRAACDRRAARRIGPAGWAGRHPPMSPSEQMRLRVSAVCDP